MGIRNRVGWSMVGLMGAGLMLAGVAAGAGPQRSTGTQPAPPTNTTIPSTGIQPIDPNDPYRTRIEDKRMASEASERRTRMLADTAKLLQLAAELKDDVDKTTKDEMSVPTIKKAAEIEKLAHDVKERMKGQ